MENNNVEQVGGHESQTQVKAGLEDLDFSMQSVSDSASYIVELKDLTEEAGLDYNWLYSSITEDRTGDYLESYGYVWIGPRYFYDEEEPLPVLLDFASVLELSKLFPDIGGKILVAYFALYERSEVHKPQCDESSEFYVGVIFDIETTITRHTQFLNSIKKMHSIATICEESMKYQADKRYP